MKQTRDDLIKEIARLGQANKEWSEADVQRRQEFAKAFSWWKPNSGYGLEKLPILPTWPEIYVKIGELLVAKTFYDFEGNVSELECKLEDVVKNIRKEINPNFP